MMKIIERLVTFYVSFDGKNFISETECASYEEANAAVLCLVGLTLEQVLAAVDRRDTDLADAIEALGNKIARARREGGDSKRELSADAKPELDPLFRDPLYRRGFRAFRDDQSYILIPEGMSHADGERWLSGWNAASLEASRSHGGAA